MRTVLLTGATGFFGSAIAKALINQGDRIVVVKRRSSNLWRLKEFLHHINFYDAEDLESVNPFEKEPVNLVIHAATNYGRMGESENQIYEANLNFPRKLLDMAIKAEVKIFFNIDTTIPSDINLYAKYKSEFCQLGKLMAVKKAINFFNIRLEHLYGSDDESYKFVQWLVESCIKNVPQISLTSGQQKRDFIHVDDAVDGLVHVINNFKNVEEGFQELQLGSGNAVSMQEFIKLVHKMTNSTSCLRFGDIPYRENEPMFSQADLSRMTALGWSPKIALIEGLQMLIASNIQKGGSL